MDLVRKDEEEIVLRKSENKKEKVKECSDLGGEENVEQVKTGKCERSKRKSGSGSDSGESCVEKSGGEAPSGSHSSKKRHREEEVLDVGIGEGQKKEKKKKRTKLDVNIENAKAISIGGVETENSFGSTNDHLRNSESKKSCKRVKFASHVEVFPSSDDKDEREENPGKKFIQGKRFTQEEDQIVIDAVHSYIEAHQLGEEGLNMILTFKKHPNLRNCWKEIGAAIPYRPERAIYIRAHTLFERAESRKLTEDEKAFVLEFYEKHGPDWKTMAQMLGKHRHDVKDKWHRLSREGLRKGRWSQAEVQSMFNLVKKDLQMLVFEEKTSKPKHRMAISKRLATRTDMECCPKWYNQLSSSMVRDGIWSDTDDYRLLDQLHRLDACCVEDVDWDNLLDHRSGKFSLKRWRQMVNHIGEHGLHSFAEQAEVLAKRYCPELLEVREALDRRPSVD